MTDPNETQEMDLSALDLDILEDDTEGYQSYDLSDDADALASIGWGTDEDYGCYTTKAH